MRNQHTDRTARNTRSHAVGTARKYHRNTSSEHHSGAIRVCKKAELLRKNVARFQIRCEQDVRVAGDIGRDSLRHSRFETDRVIEREGTLEDRTGNLSA